MIRTIRLLLVSLAMIAFVAACSADAAAPSVASLDDPDAADASPSPSAPTDPQEAFLAFAECMREHGIDMPDPEVSDEGGGKFSVGFSGGGPAGDRDMEKFQQANEACQSLLENAIGEGGRPELTPEQEQAMLDFARCMREHGVDMPDPGEGGMVFNVGGPGDDSVDREAFEAAQEACQDLLPGRLGGEDGPGLQVGPGGGANGGTDSGETKLEESN